MIDTTVLQQYIKLINLNNNLSYKDIIKCLNDCLQSIEKDTTHHEDLHRLANLRYVYLITLE